MCLQMEEMMDLVQTGAVHAIDLRQKQEELRETDQNYIQVLSHRQNLQQGLTQAAFSSYRLIAHKNIALAKVFVVQSACSVSALPGSLSGKLAILYRHGVWHICRPACASFPWPRWLITEADLQAKLAQLHRHAEVMLESVLSNPNITEESVKTMAQHERCRAPCWL